MARIIKKESQLERDYRKARNRLIVSVTLVLILFFLWMMGIVAGFFLVRPEAVPVIFISFAAAAILSGIVGKKYGILKAGLEGEHCSGDIFAGLPDSYTVVPNVQLRSSRGMAEIDHLIVGDNGIFVVETKNYRGALTGNVSDRSLMKRKVSPGGIVDQRTVKNPAIQVLRQIGILKEVLARHGIHRRIEGLVYYSNPDLEYQVYGENPNVNIFLAENGGAGQIREFIMDSAAAHLSPREQDQILNIVTQETPESLDKA